MQNIFLKTQKMYNIPHMGLTYFLALRRFWALSFLISAVFASSIAVVYVKAMDRMLYSNLQALQREKDALTVEWSQLLLEQSTWATQARVQGIAESSLNMSMPEQNNVVMINE